MAIPGEDEHADELRVLMALFKYLSPGKEIIESLPHGSVQNRATTQISPVLVLEGEIETSNRYFILVEGQAFHIADTLCQAIEVMFCFCFFTNMEYPSNKKNFWCFLEMLILKTGELGVKGSNIMSRLI